MSERRARSYVIDLARGFSLVTMTIDHTPRNILGRFSNVQFGPLGFFTGASVFVFLSGLVSASVYGAVLRREGRRATWRRALRRAAQLHAVNLSLFGLVCLAASFHLLPGLSTLAEFEPVFADPWTAFARASVLLYRPGFFDILPMYVLFMALLVPVLRLVQRGRAAWVLGASGLIWLLAQVFHPASSTSLNPLGYQILFVTGLVMGSVPDLRAKLRLPRVQVMAQIGLALAAILLALRIADGAAHRTDLPIPYWDRLTNLETNGPLRILNFALFALGLVWAWHRIPGRAKGHPLARWMAHLGRHSLPVFAWSVAATYVALAFMPTLPSRAWSVLTLVLSVSSLSVPALLHRRLARPAAVPARDESALAVPTLTPLLAGDEPR